MSGPILNPRSRYESGIGRTVGLRLFFRGQSTEISGANLRHVAREFLTDFGGCGCAGLFQHPLAFGSNPITTTVTNPISRFRAAGLGLAFLVTACAVNEAKSNPPVEQSALPSLDPVAVTAGQALSGISADSVAAADTTSVAKSAITVPSVPGRSKKDSFALVSAIRAGLKDIRWPVKTEAPLPGSILPAKRIVAYYGNPLSKKMGVLGEYAPNDMLARLDK